MYLPRRDSIATLFVAAALTAYTAWLVLADHPGASSIRVMAGVVLSLGVAASATAVVPGFEELLHSSRIYLVVASLVGLVASVAGIVALTGADTTMLAVLVATTFVMWVMATLRHVLLAVALRGPADTTSQSTPTAERSAVLVDHSPSHKR
jgi:hypothetical protein